MRADRWPAAVVGAVCTAVLLIGVVDVAAFGGAPSRRPSASHAVRPTVRPADRASRPVEHLSSAPRLRRLSAPDVLVRLTHPASAAELHALARTRGLRAVAVLDTGVLTVNRHRLRAVGVDAATVRGLTPRFTATSEALWTSLVRGEATLSYSTAGVFGRLLGANLSVGAPGGRFPATAVPVRLGAFASLGIGDAQVMVTRQLSTVLGLARARVVVFAAPSRSTAALVARARSVFGADAYVRALRPPAVRRPTVSAYARALIPPGYLDLYMRASTTCRGLPWTVLAAIGTVESRNGADAGVSSKGARGPMQFLPSTWAAYGVDATGDGRADINDPTDAVFSAARYLCSWGAGFGGQSLVDAVWAYNHADWYVRKVLTLAVALS